MGLYDRYLLAPLTDRVCASGANAKHRARVIPRARGRVVEMGAGSGLNLPFYDRAAVEALWAVEPSREMWRLAASRLADAPFARWVPSSAERVPLDDAVADTVVVTWALCTIPDPARALAEAHRLLKPDGVLLFAEHGRAPDDDVRAWQDRINPLWSRLSGGCNLNRDAPALIASAGFTVDELEAGYLPGARPFTFNVRGVARRSD